MSRNSPELARWLSPHIQHVLSSVIIVFDEKCHMQAAMHVDGYIRTCIHTYAHTYIHTAIYIFYLKTVNVSIGGKGENGLHTVVLSKSISWALV